LEQGIVLISNCRLDFQAYGLTTAIVADASGHGSCLPSPSPPPPKKEKKKGKKGGGGKKKRGIAKRGGCKGVTFLW